MKALIFLAAFAASPAWAVSPSYEAKCLIEARCETRTADDAILIKEGDVAASQALSMFGRVPTCEVVLAQLQEGTGEAARIRWLLGRFDRFGRKSCLHLVNR